ncbi:MAG: response regulator [Gammaproteobacteria bacterium]|nr:response regulator [Gammaproteobacteria bacterium]
MILIVEDELKLAELLADYLHASSYQTTLISNGLEVIPAFERYKPELILLDIMLPGKDGISLCHEIRAQSDVPIIMITARVDEIDRVLGLELGADDYICKPYSMSETVARVKAVLRRYRHLTNDIHKDGGLILEQSSLTATLDGKSLDLTAVEFQLLTILSNEPRRIFTRTQLMEKIYNDYRIVSERTIDSHIKKLRKKIAVCCDDKQLIHSVYGVGYRYECCD